MNFFAIPFVATAIALIVSWALFAIFCSLIQESIAQILAQRGRFMKDYLFKQLQDLSNGINWASLLYLHGPIDLLTRETNKPTNDIAPSLFAEAMIEVVGNSHLVQMQRVYNLTNEDKLLSPVPVYNNQLLANFKFATGILHNSDVAGLFKQAIITAESKSILHSDGKLDETEVYKNLKSHLETWYQEFMQRLSLWYKKKMRQNLFIIGALIGLFINVDSIQLFTFYNEHPDSGATVTRFYEQNEKELSALALRVDSMRGSSTDTTALDSLKNKTMAYKTTMDSLVKEAGLPVGLSYNIFNSTKKLNLPALLLKLIGVLISGFAASFGGPFWFDVLRKIYSKKL